MSEVEDLERVIRELSDADLRDFRQWFFEFDAAAWDRQLERDVAEGRLETVIDEALEEHRQGRTRPL